MPAKAAATAWRSTMRPPIIPSAARRRNIPTASKDLRDLDPDRRIVEEIDFQSEDPEFTGTMRLTTTFEPVAGGTKVTVL